MSQIPILQQTKKQILSVIIVNYNVIALLVKCLLSIREQKFSDLEIIVVDNHSEDGSCDVIRKEFPEVKLICNDNNEGFPRANNMAIQISQGSFILLLNPDTELSDNVLNRLVDYLNQHRKTSIVAPCLLNSDGTIQYSVHRFIRIWEIVAETFYLHLLLGKSRSYFNKPITSAIEVEAASGAALLIRREVFNKIGLLDEDLFWTEDMEFCFRSHQHGLKIMYLPDIKVIHHVGASGRKNLKVMISSQVLTKITFFRKNHSKIEFIFAWFFRLLHIFSRLIILCIVSIFVPKYSKKFSAYIFTFKQFVKSKY